MAGQSACIREPVNQDCEWPPDPRTGPLDLSRGSDRGHLTEDLELAEDLSIRYMDAHVGQSSGTQGEANAIYSQCATKLFITIAKAHGLTPAQLRDAIGSRPRGFDAAVMASFALLYVWAAFGVCKKIWKRCGVKDGFSGGAAMVIYVSLVAAVLGVLAGEQYAGAIEGLRLRNGHLSFRVDRVPWGHHQLAIFAVALLVFWIVSVFEYRAARRAPESAVSHSPLSIYPAL